MFDEEKVRTETRQRVCYREKSNAKCYDWLIPATAIVSESLEDIIG